MTNHTTPDHAANPIERVRMIERWFGQGFSIALGILLTHYWPDIYTVTTAVILLGVVTVVWVACIAYEMGATRS